MAIDPSGGGRDTAGIIGGYLGSDDCCYFTHDRSARMSSAEWSKAACELAMEIEADRIIVETNFGGDMATLAIRTAWDALRRERPDEFGPFVPRVVTVRAKRGKILRAEPIAQQWVQERCWTTSYLPEFESQWATHQPTDTTSPGALDAGVYLAFGVLPVPQSGSSTMTAANMLAQSSLLSWGAGGR